MIRPLVLRPCNFVCRFTSAGQALYNTVPFTPIIQGEVVTIYEIIKIQISGLPLNCVMTFSSQPFLNGTPQNNKNILFLYDVSNSSNAILTHTYDFTDGRGNGLRYGGDALCISCSSSTAIVATFFCNIYTRQRDISMTEYIQLREVFES